MRARSAGSADEGTRVASGRANRLGVCSLAAPRRIYFGAEQPFDGRLRLALLGPEVDDRSAVRPLLEREGFAALSSTAYVGVTDASPQIAGIGGVFLVTADPGKNGPAVAA